MAGLDLQFNQQPARAASQMANPFPPPQQAALGNILGSGQGQFGGPPPLGPPTGQMSSPGAPVTMAGDPHGEHMAKPGYGAIRNAFQAHLGRDGSPQDILQHAGDGSWAAIQYAIGNIANSPEAKLYQMQQKAAKQQGMQQSMGGPMMGNGMPNPQFGGGGGMQGGGGAGPTAGPGASGAPNGGSAPPKMPSEGGGSVFPGAAPQPAAPQQTAALPSQQPQYMGNNRDPQYIEGMIKQWGQTPGVNPSVINDPAYWERQILSKPDGLSPANAEYWKGLAMTPEGGRPAPGGAGGGDPMLQYAMSFPAIQQGGPDQANAVIQNLLRQLALGGATGAR